MVDMISRKEVRVANPCGLHIRPAYLFARLAAKYEASVEIVKEGQSVNGKSVLEILMLAATRDTVLTIVARGKDAEQAVETLASVIERETPPEGDLPLADEAGAS
jgi:phosphotransferase system HPr (HPr) family protein